ncbi:hypothetical protein EDE15_3203 [Edaphobacter aggregans]|uniref:Uncharacterized protein n=1 Tax=Edaphobacter aggregans TaxID=570835 RepID=A0A3R9QJ06_9BACT|nr:hypothetical protein EDE15_3203 [Edaphobacter aggregans]
MLGSMVTRDLVSLGNPNETVLKNYVERKLTLAVCLHRRDL